MVTTKIENGILTYKSSSFFSKKNYEIRLDEVDFIVPRKGWILPHYIHIGNRKGEFYKIRVDKNFTKKLLEVVHNLNAPIKDNLDKVMEFDDSTESLKTFNPKAINKNSLWLLDEYVIYVPERFVLARDASPVCIPINDVRFSTTSPATKWKIIPDGHQTYFGTPQYQAVFKHPKVDHSNKIVDYLKGKGAKIGMESDTEFKDTFWLGKLLKPLLFRRKETIGFNKEGIIYTFKKGKQSETIFLPFEGVKYATLKKGLFRSHHIAIVGEQNIFTKLQFPNEAIQMIKDELDTKNVKQASLIVRPRMMLGLVNNPLAKRSFALLDDKIIFTDKKAKDATVFNFDEVHDIAWKKKYPFFFVGYLFIQGSATNFRKDQADLTDSLLILPKIWYTKKNIIKNTIGAQYNDKKFKKYCSISDVTYS